MINYRRLSFFATLIGILAVAAIACGGDDEPAAPVRETVLVPQTVEVPATVLVERTVEVPSTVIVERTVVATSTAIAAPPTPTVQIGNVSDNAPDPKQDFGHVVFAVDEVRPGLGRAAASGGEGALVQWGVGETLFTTASTNDGPVFGQPWLIESWEISDDLTEVNMTTVQGAQFHEGWGELTAEDIVFTINDANARTNPESIHGQAGDLANIWDEWEATGRYTIRAPMHNFDPRWQNNALSDGFQLTGIFSKKVFDDLGPEGARDTIVMTGPFSVNDWSDGERAVLDAVPDHWRAAPMIDQLTFIEVPEASVRQAMLLVGSADIGQVNQADIPGMLEDGFLTTGTQGGAELNIAFSGNLWETNQATSGEVLPRGGLDTSKPWISDWMEVDPQGFERAAKVRTALSMAIDREGLVEALTGGLGWPHYIPMFNPAMPQHKDDWIVPFDVDGAKALLNEAGYPNGFEIEIFGQCCDNDRQFVAEAVGAMWRQNLGLDVEVQSFSYRPVWRAGLVERTTSVPHVHACDDGRLPRPWDWPVGITFSSLSRGGFSCAVESPFVAQTWLDVARESDPEKRLEMNMAVGDHYRETMIGTGVFTVPALIVYNPKAIAEWQPRPSLFGPITGVEAIVPVNR